MTRRPASSKNKERTKVKEWRNTYRGRRKNSKNDAGDRKGDGGEDMRTNREDDRYIKQIIKEWKKERSEMDEERRDKEE